MFDNFLPKAFIISMTLHLLFLCTTLAWQWPQVKKAKSKNIEIQYRPQVQKKTPDVREHPVKPAQQFDLKSVPMTPTDGAIPLKMDKKKQTLGSFALSDRKPEQLRSAQMQRKVSVTPIKSEKINNPAYAAYNEMVRSRIEEKVYANFGKMEAGTVYLTFIIASDGSLKASQLIDEKTEASSNLRDVSMKSLKQAQFPPFLKGMTLPEYSFNIEIQYQVKD